MKQYEYLASTAQQSGVPLTESLRRILDSVMAEIWQEENPTEKDSE